MLLWFNVVFIFYCYHKLTPRQFRYIVDIKIFHQHSEVAKKSLFILRVSCIFSLTKLQVEKYGKMVTQYFFIASLNTCDIYQNIYIEMCLYSLFYSFNILNNYSLANFLYQHWKIRKLWMQSVSEKYIKIYKQIQEWIHFIVAHAFSPPQQLIYLIAPFHFTDT